jgi:outer membrane protein assembly factor BamD (BamD/ComL family)
MFISPSHTIILIHLLLAFCSVAYAQSNDAKLANEYYQQGEQEKAYALFSDLDNDRNAVPLIFANYTELLRLRSEFTKCEKFILWTIKQFPSQMEYRISLLDFYEMSGNLDKKEKYLKELEKDFGQNENQLNMLARGLLNKQMMNESLYFFLKARKLIGTTDAYALDIATVYRMQGNKSKMTEEYLNYAESNPRNIAYIKNMFQSLMVENDEQDLLETALISRIQKNPDITLYADLLIWLEIQRKNFTAAFIQAKAYDRRLNTQGEECMRVGMIAMDNAAWNDAVEIFSYVIEKYPNSRTYIQSKTLLIQAKENKVKNEYPIDKQAIRNLANEYQQLIHELEENPNTLDVMRTKARLHAFYLNELDTAIQILNKLIINPRAPRTLISQSKLDLGDIYLLDGQPWESTLLYSQVEKTDKESPVGYEAKLRNAKLNYFTGNFSLAKDHLNILKLATTREISNDAIALSMLIQNNTVFDTTDLIMQQYANIELLIYQNKKMEAEAALEKMLIDNPNHSLSDEIYWQLSNLSMEKADFNSAINFLDQIVNKYGTDILADDAFYRKAVILSDYLHEDEKALEILIDFLKKYPGSLYTAEARTRIRKLRGDYIN